MKIDYLKTKYLNGKSKLAPVLLLAVSAFWGVLILTKQATLFAASARPEKRRSGEEKKETVTPGLKA